MDHHLEVVLCPADFLILLHLDKFPAFCLISDVPIDKIRLVKPGSVELGFLGVYAL